MAAAPWAPTVAMAAARRLTCLCAALGSSTGGPSTAGAGAADATSGEARWVRILELEAELAQLRAGATRALAPPQRPPPPFIPPQLAELRARAAALIDPSAAGRLGRHTIRWRELRNARHACARHRMYSSMRRATRWCPAC